jgi:predicted CXXCH cytochrome family protein
MKKVLVLAAAIALFATPALAAITGTKHDLSVTNATTYNGSSDEICVYCHTPHGADTTIANAPLWNRSKADATAIYSGLDINASISLGKVNASDAPLCLSCHDGSSLTDALNNPPNAGGGNPGINITSDANLGKDLSDDHPIGFNYDATLVAADGELVAAPVDVKFFGDDGNEMWCSSCHDVHSNSKVPFLNVSIQGSQLCKACHVK